ncbi:hypothetical protein [Polyangium jinanense]|uniref:Uncharacterized protein n=1 Tax=Polyangium jinanense TaxID=2829994 RepID=A0A9X3WXA7_9BACT|nr:hypothetical protein [Polyangium jinanense]MDC3953070.1 hypothetical protein [Polyangium jinanense]MDC3979817.1 hypothetical protein [Polyangium jinanense]
MRNLTLGDLRLSLRDLLDTRVDELRLSKTGKLYEPRLRKKQTEIESIPDPALTQAPLAAELASTDGLHDGLGTAIHYVCLAVEAHPMLAPSKKDAAKRIRETFIPQLAVLRRPYIDEAAAALDSRKQLDALEPDLTAITTPGGGNLFAWATDFLAAGDSIDSLLRERAKLLACAENAASTAPLRASTLGLLGRFRDALRDELEEEASLLPANYEASLFAYIDKLSADRARAAMQSGAPSEDAPLPAQA